MGATIEVVSNTRSRLTGITYEQARNIYEKFSVEVPGAKFSPAVISRAWDGRRRFFDLKSGWFPTGLLHKVKKAVRDVGRDDLKVFDRRARRSLTYDPTRLQPEMLKGLVLRDYQLAATKAVLEVERGILRIATNGGKSAIASAFIKAFVDLPTTLYLVHKKVLLRQARQALASHLGLLEEHIGEIGSGKNSPRRITVATVQSLYSKVRVPIIKAFLASIDVLVMDECHHYKGGMFLKVANAIDAPHRLALSGTPFPSAESKMMIEAACGRVAYRVTNDQLINLGVSARPTVEIVLYDSQPLENTWEWPAIYKTGVVENEDRNVAIVQQIKKKVDAGLQVLVLVAHTWHGELLSTMLNAVEIKHVFLHSKIDHAIAAGKERFENKQVSVLVATPIFDEGVNISGVQVLVVADGGKSFRSLLQKVGRALRRKVDGPNEVSIVDFSDQGHRLLARHSLKRIAIYEEENFDVVAATV